MTVQLASLQGADGAGDLLQCLKPFCCWLRGVFAGNAYNSVTALLACFVLGLTLIVVPRR